MSQKFLALVFFSFFLSPFTCFSSETKFRVDDTSASVFFGESEANPDFNYKGWAKKNTLCKKDFKASEWDAYQPIPKADPTKTTILPRMAAEKILVRFNKPGGFSDTDLDVLRSIIESKITIDSPYVVAGALQNVLALDSSLYDLLIKSYPILSTCRFEEAAKNPFRTKNEEKLIFSKVEDYLDAQMERLIPDPERGNRLEDWVNLASLAPVLKTLSPADREQSEDQIMERIVDLALETDFKGSGNSFLFPVVEPLIEPLFGDAPEIITMLEITRSGDVFTPKVHGTHPITGLQEKPNRHHFYSTNLASFSLNEPGSSEPHTYLWGMAGHRFEAKVNVIPIKQGKKLYETDSTPNYQNMLVEGELGALILFGTNLKRDRKVSLDEYEDYLKADGFHKEKKEKLSDVKSWFKDQIISGQTAFFGKEAHASADVDNFLEVDNDAELLTYVREAKGNLPREVVRIAYPYDEESDSVTISDIEMGQWLRQRAKETKVPLVFANMSCWSVDQARLQIPEFRTSLVSQIFSTTVVDEFANIENSGGRILVDGFLKGESYPEMRAKLSMNRPRATKAESDDFVFPDEQRYGELLFQGGSPVNLRWEIRDIDTGELYNGDDLTND